jgi:hypothetical protein
VNSQSAAATPARQRRRSTVTAPQVGPGNGEAFLAARGGVKAIATSYTLTATASDDSDRFWIACVDRVTQPRLRPARAAELPGERLLVRAMGVVGLARLGRFTACER